MGNKNVMFLNYVLIMQTAIHISRNSLMKRYDFSTQCYIYIIALYPAYANYSLVFLNS